MSKLYSYVLRYDDGAAPNPFWGLCTLTICKPAIRRTASVGDWVIGTGSANALCNDGKRHHLSGFLVYAMKVTQILSLEEYDRYCQDALPEKIPDFKNSDWRRRMGDCIYDYSKGERPRIRQGVHNEGNRERDLSGKRSLLSSHFYYFGEHPITIPPELFAIIKKGQGHKKVENLPLIQEFERWISCQHLNMVEADPQMRHLFDRLVNEDQLTTCATCHWEEDGHEEEETVC